MNRPTVVVADDHDLILDALRGVLGREYRIGEGQSAKAIANKLSISSKTVEFHKSRIQFSLGLRSTADMIRYALSQP